MLDLEGSEPVVMAAECLARVSRLHEERKVHASHSGISVQLFGSNFLLHPVTIQQRWTSLAMVIVDTGFLLGGEYFPFSLFYPLSPEMPGIFFFYFHFVNHKLLLEKALLDSHKYFCCYTLLNKPVFLLS